MNLTSPELEAAESGLIGAALTDSRVALDVDLSPECFLSPRWGTVWKAVTKGPVDPIELAARTPGIELADLSGAIASAGTLANVHNWATLVREAWVKRQLLSINSALTGDINDDITTVRSRIERLEGSTGRKLPRLNDLLTPDYSNPGGLPSGLELERVVPGGIPRSRVTVIMGESGNFKTTVVNNMIWAMAKAGHSVLDVSLEDSDALTSHRFMARFTGIPYGKFSEAHLMTPAERRLVDNISAEQRELAGNVIMGGSVPPNIEEIIRLARYHKQHDNLAAVFIDYLQLLDGPSKLKEHEKIAHVLRAAQLSAKRDNIAYIFTSQVKQDVDTRDDPRPRITDGLGSSAIRTHSKLTVGVHRPSKYFFEPRKGTHYTSPYKKHHDIAPNGKTWYKNLLELHVLKNVVGEAEVVLHATVDPPTGVIEPISIKEYL